MHLQVYKLSLFAEADSAAVPIANKEIDSQSLALLMQAIKWSASVWYAMLSETISNCWRKADILPKAGEGTASAEQASAAFEAEERQGLAALGSLMDELELGPNAIDPASFVDLPEENEVEEELSNEDLIALVRVSLAHSVAAYVSPESLHMHA